MPSGTSSSCGDFLQPLAVVGAGDLAADAAAARGVRHQHRIAAGEREIGRERRALGAALFLDHLHQHDLPALDHLLDLVLRGGSAARAPALLPARRRRRRIRPTSSSLVFLAAWPASSIRSRRRRFGAGFAVLGQLRLLDHRRRLFRRRASAAPSSAQRRERYPSRRARVLGGFLDFACWHAERFLRDADRRTPACFGRGGRSARLGIRLDVGAGPRRGLSVTASAGGLGVSPASAAPRSARSLHGSRLRWRWAPRDDGAVGDAGAMVGLVVGGALRRALPRRSAPAGRRPGSGNNRDGFPRRRGSRGGCRRNRRRRPAAKALRA